MLLARSSGVHSLWALHRFLRSGVRVRTGDFSGEQGYALIPPGKTFIHSTNAPVDIRHGCAMDFAVLGDAKLVFRPFVEAVRGRTDGTPGATEEGQVALLEFMCSRERARPYLRALR